MATDARITEVTHRLFREPRLSAARPQDPVEQDDLSRRISQSIGMIEKASETVESMQETVRMHEDTIYNQNNAIVLLNSQKEDSFGKLLQLEQLCRREAERATKADAQASALSERLRILEQRNTTLTAQLDRMMQAVSKSFASWSSDETAAATLRSVS